MRFRPILPGLLLALIALPLMLASIAVSRWLHIDYADPEQQQQIDRDSEVSCWRTLARERVLLAVEKNQLSLLEAAAWFRHLYAQPPVSRTGLDAEAYCRDVIGFSHQRSRSSAGIRRPCPEVAWRLEAELQSLLDSPGALLVPEPPELPGMPPRPEE